MGCVTGKEEALSDRCVIGEQRSCSKGKSRRGKEKKEGMAQE